MSVPHDLAPLFRPRSVAIVGASAAPHKWGHIVMRNVLEAGFQGTVYPVNP
ncbi:MAG: CoA-binding protein, partial [Acidimicrobiia bacterium]